MDDPGPGNLIFKLILLFALILVNAFFAMSEIAIISLNENKLRHMAEEGNKRARQLLTLTADSARFLSTIQVRNPGRILNLGLRGGEFFRPAGG